MRAIPLLLATSACSQIFGIDSPQLVDAPPVDTAPMSSDAPPPDGMMSVTFQQELDGYAGVRDTFIDMGSPNSTKETDSIARIRMGDRWGLLAFTSIFGPALIPPNAQLASATLEVRIQNLNCVGAIADVEIGWNDTVTYNTFGILPGVQNPDHGAPFAALSSPTDLVSINVLDSVKMWQATSANHGWIFIGTGGNECSFRTSEDGNATQRPRLTVTFTP